MDSLQQLGETLISTLKTLNQQMKENGEYTNFVFDLPGGYEYEVYYNVVSPSSHGQCG